MDATRNKDALGMGVALYNTLLCVEILELLLLPGIFSEHGIYGSFHNQILDLPQKTTNRLQSTAWIIYYN